MASAGTRYLRVFGWILAHPSRKHDRLVAMHEGAVLAVPGDGAGQHRAFGLADDPCRIVRKNHVSDLDRMAIKHISRSQRGLI